MLPHSPPSHARSAARRRDGRADAGLAIAAGKRKSPTSHWTGRRRRPYCVLSWFGGIMKFHRSMRPLAVSAACAVVLGLMAATSPALATAGVPIQGTSVGLDHEPDGIIAHGTTDSDGNVSFRDLKPGHYVLVIDDKGLAAPIPEKKSGGSSFSIGVGGMFGGGGSHDSGKGGAYGHGSHSSSGGGVGLGVTLSGGDSGSGNRQEESSVEVVVVTGSRIPQQGLHQAEDTVSLKAVVRRDAPKDLRLAIDLPEGGTVRIRLALSDEPVPRNIARNETWISGVGDDARPSKNDTWISGVGDDASVDSRPPKNATGTPTSPTGDLGEWGVRSENGGAKPQDAGRTWTSGVGDDANPCGAKASCVAMTGVKVSAVDVSGRVVGRMTTGAKGEAEFRTLSPGHYTLTIDKRDLSGDPFHATNTTGEYDRTMGKPGDGHAAAARRVHVSLTIGGRSIGTPVISGDVENGVAIAFDVPRRGPSDVRFEVDILRDNSETQTAE